FARSFRLLRHNGRVSSRAAASSSSMIVSCQAEVSIREPACCTFVAKRDGTRTHTDTPSDHAPRCIVLKPAQRADSDQDAPTNLGGSFPTPHSAIRGWACDL